MLSLLEQCWNSQQNLPPRCWQQSIDAYMFMIWKSAIPLNEWHILI